MIHPTNRLERKRSAEAKALRLFKPKKINGKKRHKIVELLEKETQDELQGIGYIHIPDQYS
jgi:hypothetical protein